MLFDDKKIEFVLLEKLKGVDTKGWIFFAAAAVLAAALIIFLVQRRKKCTEPATFTGNPTPTVILVHGALCIAISFVLSYFKLFSMPNGGSITLASMLPLMVYSNRYGAKYGVMAGVVYGFLQYIQKPEMTHWIQMLVDYPIAFGVIGLGGLVKGERNLVFSVLIGGTLRFLCHLFTGAVFFGEYAAAGQSAFMYSLLYNAPYMFATSQFASSSQCFRLSARRSAPRSSTETPNKARLISAERAERFKFLHQHTNPTSNESKLA